MGKINSANLLSHSRDNRKIYSIEVNVILAALEVVNMLDVS